MTSSLIDRLNAVSEQVALKRPVRVASTSNLTLSGFQTIDGVAPAPHDDNLRVLVKNQAVPSENGIYTMTTGTWERTHDFDGNRDVVKGTRVPVTEGIIGANKTYVVTASDRIVIDTSAITFAEITESLVTTEFAKPRAPIVAVSSDITLTAAAHAGRQIDVDCGAADRVITLPAAAGMTDGDQITIRYATGTNQITIACQGADAINGATSLAMTSRYESLTLSTSGNNWTIVGHARPFAMGGVVFINVVSRTLITPPISPEPGARYIIAASGTPAGSWSAYANNDVVESNGQGGWFRYSPAAGWQAYDRNANQNVLFTGASWEGLPATDDPAQSNLRKAIFSDVKAQNTSGGSNVLTTGVWTTRILNTSEVNTITGVSLAANQVSIPAGEYLVLGNSCLAVSGAGQIRFKSTTTSAQIRSLNINLSAGDNVAEAVSFGGYLSLPAQEVFELQYYVANGNANGLGVARNVGSETELYSRVIIIDLTSLQGAQGDPGIQGPEGFAGLKYTYSTATGMADPGAGIVRLNNAALSSVTVIAIDDTSAATGYPDVSAEILSWDDSSSIAKGKLKLSKVGAVQNFVIYTIVSLTDNAGWTQLAVNYVTHAGSFSNTDSLAVEFIEKGDKGDTGSTGPTGSTTFNFDNAITDSDPGSGDLRLNHATPASATTAFIDNSNRGGSSVITWLDSFDDSGASSNRGTLIVSDAVNPSTIFCIYKVTGSVVDGTGYRKVTISTLGGAGSFTSGNEVLVTFLPTGATGTAGGSTGVNDNRILRADGVGGTTIQNSTISVDDSGNMSGVGTFTNTGAVTQAVVVLTDGATPALDASLGNIFTLVAAGDRTIAVPSNVSSGQKIIIRHLASAGARTLALNTGAGGFRFGSDVTGLTQTASGKYDYIGCVYNAVDSKWDVVAYSKGY